MASKKARRNASANVRRHVDDKTRIIEKFDEEVRRGSNRRDIARNLKVSLPAIYRWKRSQSILLVEPNEPSLDTIDIDHIIATLANPEISDRLSLLNALFQLIVWMNFPTEVEHHSVGVVVCTVRYLATDTGSQKLSEITSDRSSLITDKINIRTLQRLCSYESVMLPSFEVWPIDGQPYDEFDYFADVARILIEYDASSQDRRDAASLSKARYALYRGAFLYRWEITPETFRNYWSQYGSSSPFLYVRRYHMKRNFVIDPNDRDFAESVDQIIDDRSQLILFLRRCRAAVEALQSRLDRRALSNLRLPNFPSWLEPAALPKTPFPTSAEAILRSYGRADKR